MHYGAHEAIGPDAVIGRYCESRAGRDKGKTFIIVGLCEDHEHVFICDGKLRKLARPKKKKLMHLRVSLRGDDELRALLSSGKTVQDAQIRKSIARFHGLSEDPKAQTV